MTGQAYLDGNSHPVFVSAGINPRDTGPWLVCRRTYTGSLQRIKSLRGSGPGGMFASPDEAQEALDAYADAKRWRRAPTDARYEDGDGVRLGVRLRSRTHDMVTGRVVAIDDDLVTIHSDLSGRRYAVPRDEIEQRYTIIREGGSDAGRTDDGTSGTSGTSSDGEPAQASSEESDDPFRDSDDAAWWGDDSSGSGGMHAMHGTDGTSGTSGPSGPSGTSSDGEPPCDVDPSEPEGEAQAASEPLQEEPEVQPACVGSEPEGPAEEPEAVVMEERGRITRSLPVGLTDAELLALGQVTARATRELDAIEERRKEFLAQCKLDAQRADAELRRASGLIEARYEYRDVDCTEIVDRARMLRTIIRDDTGEVVETVRLQDLGLL